MATNSGNKGKVIWATITLAILTFIVLALRPLPKANRSNCSKYSGIVSQIMNGAGEGDIVIKIKSDKNYYYINRATEHGILISDLNEKLVNKEVELFTIKHWTPLDPISRTKHIAEIRMDGALIYSEM
ncbi:MAG TPA: hypothetical protein VLR49_08695 [Ferruginibacter sp.]|nr:hypothetical protein [Ferruginibacter sp.]